MAAVFPANQVIVVGGGLAGMSAANTVVENGGRTGQKVDKDKRMSPLPWKIDE